MSRGKLQLNACINKTEFLNYGNRIVKILQTKLFAKLSLFFRQPIIILLQSDSIDIELGKQDPSSNNIPFKYKKLRPKASIHYHSGPDRMSLSSSLMDEAQEPLISGNL